MPSALNGVSLPLDAESAAELAFELNQAAEASGEPEG